MSLLLTADELREITGLRRPHAIARYMLRLGAPAFVNAANQVVVPRLWLENWCKPDVQKTETDEEYNVRHDLLPGGTSEPPAHPQRR
jgi:hypothetical protein